MFLPHKITHVLYYFACSYQTMRVVHVFYVLKNNNRNPGCHCSISSEAFMLFVSINEQSLKLNSDYLRDNNILNISRYFVNVILISFLRGPLQDIYNSYTN